jgi:hypothetical protein
MTRIVFAEAPPTVPGNIIGKKKEKRNFYQLRPSTVKPLQLRHSIGEYLPIITITRVYVLYMYSVWSLTAV